jgi:hypothetical protein
MDGGVTMRVLKMSAAAVLAVPVAAGVLTASPALAADATVNCRPGPPANANMSVARIVYDTARAMSGMTDRVLLAGFEAAIVESHVNNCSNGDRDSVGVFQQRASWGSYAERTTVSIASRKFFGPALDAARANPSWTAGQVAQKVQVSAFPARYDQAQAPAQRLIAQLRGNPVTPPQLSTATVSSTTIRGTTRGWTVRANGTVTAFGGAPGLGDARGIALNAAIVGMSGTATGNGYWLTAADGGVFAFGDAQFQGSMGGKPLNKPIVGMTATPSGSGYWLVASDGGIFAFGDAAFHGSMGGKPLNRPMVGMASTSTGRGYWSVASDGGIFAFGDAAFHGSMGGKPLNQPVTGMSATPSGRGYWMVAADGGIFSFGDAAFRGSATNAGAAAAAIAPYGAGYEVTLADGRVLIFT